MEVRAVADFDPIQAQATNLPEDRVLTAAFRTSRRSGHPTRRPQRSRFVGPADPTQALSLITVKVFLGRRVLGFASAVEDRTLGGTVCSKKHTCAFVQTRFVVECKSSHGKALAPLWWPIATGEWPKTASDKCQKTGMLTCQTRSSNSLTFPLTNPDPVTSPR